MCWSLGSSSRTETMVLVTPLIEGRTGSFAVERSGRAASIPWCREAAEPEKKGPITDSVFLTWLSGLGKVVPVVCALDWICVAGLPGSANGRGRTENHASLF